MNKYYLFSLLFFLSATRISAQTVSDHAVQLQATVQESPAQIKLSWKPLAGATSYQVYRRAKDAANWGTALASGTDTFYTDNNVATGTAYEYRVVKSGGTITAYGYIYAGVAASPIHNRGALLLLVDSLFTDSCAAQIAQLEEDISGDGWQVIRRDVARTLPHTGVHDLIGDTRQDNPDLAAVLLLGHIAVPYSGNLNPDGHSDHVGAWPADVYYGSHSGGWSDVSVNNTTASQARNHNIPGDGKWDQSVLPVAVELQVSRIDFHNMPAFGKTEVELMQSYLNRLHRYKMDSLNIARRALIDDNFSLSGFPEAFAANGWRNFPPLTGRDQIHEVDFISSLNDSSFQWAYGCGGGTYTSASNIGTTTNFTTSHVNGIFTMLFGSYFGDWDSQNNFLRAPLCAETPALTSCWAARPNWHFHHMAQGAHIGYSTRLSQNNSSAATGYVTGFGARGVHIALMGDLTLRTDYIQPASGLTVATTAGQGAVVSWTASPDAGVDGYYVYRSGARYGRYDVVSTLVSTTSFTDTIGADGLWYYMVRPAKKTSTPSGSYYNLGLGITDSATVDFPVPAGISMIQPEIVSVYPNPVHDEVHIRLQHTGGSRATFLIMDMNGRIVGEQTTLLHAGIHDYSLSTGHLSPGMYILQLADGERVMVRKLVKD